MNANPLISVVILNYNNSIFLEECLASVLNQTYDHIEVVLVDNGSTDESLEIASRFKKQIKLIRLDVNMPQGYARNCGILQTSGNFIALLDSDDYWVPKKLEFQFPLLSENCQLVYSGISKFHENHNEYVAPKYRGDVYSYFLDPRMEAVILGGESTALVDKNLIRNSGDFNPKFSSTAGWDFFMRCSQITKVDYIEFPLTNVRLHPDNVSKRHLQVSSEMFTTFYGGIAREKSLSKVECAIKISLFSLYLLKGMLLGPKSVSLISKARIVALVSRRYPLSLFRILCKQSRIWQ